MGVFPSGQRLSALTPLIKTPPERLTAFWSWRAVVLSLLLLPLNLYWVGVTEGLWHALHMTTLSLPMNVLVSLLALTAFNRLLAKSFPLLSFDKRELILIHIALTVQSALIGHDMLITLFGVISAPAWLENPFNRWRELFFPYLPEGFVITEKSLVRSFYLGGASFYGTEWEKFWWRPAFLWSSFLFFLSLAYLAFTVPFYQRWTREERLCFPIVQLPLRVVEGGIPWGSRVFWSGFCLAAGVDMVNHFHALYPRVPFLRVRARDRDLRWYLTEPPWNAIGSMPIALYPFIIGYGYLMPLDLCTSAWFFYLVRKVGRVLGRWLGLAPLRRFPYTNEQAAGAALAVAIGTLWRNRNTLKAFGKATINDISFPSPLAPTLTVFLFVIAVAFCGGISLKAGMGAMTAALFWLIHLLIALTVTRLRAEAGPPSHSLWFANPQDLMLVTVGVRSFRPKELTALALFYWFNRLNRNHLMPVFMEGWRFGDALQIPFSRLGPFMLTIVALSVLSGFAFYLHLFYREGAATRIGEVVWVGQDTFNRLASWLNHPRPPDSWGRTFVIGGFLLTLVLYALYHRYPWWGLHPLGYLLGTSFAVDYYWFCLLLSSTIKWLLLRYGGAHLAHAATPFFVGLIFGEGIVACAWSVYGLLVHKPMYDAWW